MTVLEVILILLAVNVGYFLAHRLLPRRLSRDGFMDAVRSRILQRPEITIKSDLDFGFKCQYGSSEIDMYLDNLYAEYRMYPKQLDTIVEHCLDNLVQAEPDRHVGWDQAKRLVFPSVRPVSYFQSFAQVEGGQEVLDSMVLFDFTGSVNTALVLDLEGTMRFVRADEVEDWDVTREALMQQAMNNLASSTGPLWERASLEAKRTGIFRFTTNDGYDSARILLPDLPERICRALDCERIAVAIPMRDTLFAVRADNPKAVDQLRNASKAIFSKSHHPISSDLFFLPTEA